MPAALCPSVVAVVMPNLVYTKHHIQVACMAVTIAEAIGVASSSSTGMKPHITNLQNQV